MWRATGGCVVMTSLALLRHFAHACIAGARGLEPAAQTPEQDDRTNEHWPIEPALPGI